MPSKPPILFPSQERLLAAFGERLRLARLRRDLGTAVVAARASISRTTLQRAEDGSPAVTMGTYLRILSVLHLADDLEGLAKDDRLGRKLQDLGLPERKRARKTIKPVA
jgi:transcriptional regulator with XRE-family HTH domain